MSSKTTYGLKRTGFIDKFEIVKESNSTIVIKSLEPGKNFGKMFKVDKKNYLSVAEKVEYLANSAKAVLDIRIKAFEEGIEKLKEDKAYLLKHRMVWEKGNYDDFIQGKIGIESAYKEALAGAEKELKELVPGIEENENGFPESEAIEQITENIKAKRTPRKKKVVEETVAGE